MIEELQCYVINLERSKKRMNEFKKGFRRTNLKIDRIAAVDGNLININSFADDYLCRKEMGRSIQPGEVGCFLSHKKALERFLSTDSKYAIIFEDDAIPENDFKDNIEFIIERFLQKNKKTAAVNLGAVDFKYSSQVMPLKNNLIRCAHRFPMLATGVLWTRLGANKFLENSSSVTMPYDNFLRFLFSGTNSVFSIQPPIISSSGIESDIEARNDSRRRSTQNRSKYYFFIKQRRIFRDKLRAVVALISWILFKKSKF